MSIFLIRHAESEANINVKTLSHALITLSEHGHKQAQALCSQLPKIDHVIVSRYLRTHQTAAPLLEKYNLTLEIDEHVHEFSYLSERKCANTNMDDRKAWVNTYWEKMDYQHRDADDAESFEDLYIRVQAFHEKLKALTENYAQKNLAVFSHGQFLQLLMMQIQQPQPLSKELMRQFRFNLINQPIGNTQIFTY
ncbi:MULTISPECIES: histidine phosphatase family protein [Acinetobacter calcoaceticus/baumannii complex]|uniref:histidine phosphatase family protein n=1 Tax=Acinetobacter calcoaceticus/baumannii complex TaxID=909768 RepID=UPI00044C315E|nr:MULTISPECIES: histidine phosphatase family protein [Acinetobacter calcoaceticus/baumannii complex]EXE61278.1 histidine phosphatase super family protein [Acinetobacter sp. 1542444]KRI61530.1 alpha-ribazole phosphatase [Acinetobacter pittii]MCU4400023.1 histidine phosphatase family protein [Acinetobacter pittii]MCU4403307.1 histidine phosphatase family protein [Acinetobacter pittii]MCU4462741.1 histidine phosphatase family protein [Acinetobacter pittii]